MIIDRERENEKLCDSEHVSETREEKMKGRFDSEMQLIVLSIPLLLGH